MLVIILVFTGIFTTAISAQICWYFDVLPFEILIPLLDVLLICSLVFAFVFYPLSHRKKRVVSIKKPVQSNPQPEPVRDKLIRRWLQTKSANLHGKLPLDRIAFLKARYQIGPFQKCDKFSDCPLSFFKKQAEKCLPVTSFCGSQLLDHHPRTLVTNFTENYIQHRALLYYIQQIDNVNYKYQLTKLEESGSTPEPPKKDASSLVPAEMPDTEILELAGVAEIFQDNQVSMNMQNDFEREMEESRKKLDQVRSVFQIMRQTEKDQERAKELTETEEAGSWWRRLFFSNKNKKK